MQNLFLLWFIAALAACPLVAQQPAPTTPTPPVTAGKPPSKPAPAQPPGDPFIRQPNPPSAPVPASESKSAVSPNTLLITIETWALSQGDFAELLEGPANERAPYDRLEALAKEGK